MLRKRLITVLTFNNGILFRTKKFNPDYRYTLNFVNNSYIDEIIILDVSRENKLKKTFIDVVKSFSKNCFVPISVGGGIRSLDDVKLLMSSGADKVVINTGALNDINLIKDISSKYGKQCVVLSIDALRKSNNEYSVYSNDGQINTEIEPHKWAKDAESFGVGEIMITSIENDGALDGYDLILSKKIINSVNIPVLLLGGAGNWKHFEEGLKIGASAVCTQNIFHFTESSILSAKSYLKKQNYAIRF